MASARKILAFDLGAESGRGVLGLLDGGKLELEVVRRFPNGAVRTLDSLHWDVLRLYSEMLGTLRDWEQGRTEPDQPARTYLMLIARDPEYVARVLNPR